METKRGTKIIQKIFSIIFLDLILLLPLFYYYGKHKQAGKALSDIGIKRIDKKELTIKSLQLIAILFLIALSVSVFTSLLGLNDLQKVTETVKQIGQISPVVFLYYLTVRVLTEEIFFRGFLVKKTGIFFSAVLFGLAHFMYGSVTEVFGAFAAGLFLAYYYKKNNNLLPNIIGHMAYNAIVFLLVF